MGDEIYNQTIFINEDVNIKHSEIVQQVGEGIDVHYTQFNKYLFCSEADAIYISQKIEYIDQAGIETIVFPIVSVTNSRKKPVEKFERLSFKIGGWVLKALGKNKTLVNVFFNTKFSKTEIPEIIISKHAKSMISMLRTLETFCNKHFVDYRLGSKIFEKTQTLVSNEEDKSNQVYDEGRDETKQTIYEEDKKMTYEIDEESSGEFVNLKETPNGIFIPTPPDIPEIDPNTLTEPYKEHILGTRSRLDQLIELINGGTWKSVSKKKGINIYTKLAESGLA